MNLFWGCNAKNETEVLYKKADTVTTDPTCIWLKNSENFFKPSYMPVFYKFYNKKIKEKDYHLALRALELMLWNNDFADTFTEETLETAKRLSRPFINKVRPYELNFLYYFFGKFYRAKGDFNTAIYYYKKVDQVEVVNYKSCAQKSLACQEISWCYSRMGKQDVALAYSFKALEYIKKTDTQILVPPVYNTLSAIYESLKDYKNALLYTDKTLAFYKEGQEEMWQDNKFVMLCNKVRLLDIMGKQELRAKLLDSTYHAYKKKSFSHPPTKVLINTMYVKKLIDEKKIVEAKAILDELAPEVKALNYGEPNKQYAIALAQFEAAKGRNLINKKFIIDAIPSLIETEDYYTLREMYVVLYEDALIKKEFKTALEYLEEINSATDTLDTRARINKAAEFKEKYKAKEKESKILLQEKTILNNKATISLLISVVLGLLILTVYIISRQKQKRLQFEKENIQLYTKQLLEKTEEERKRISSDLHDSVSHELLGLKNPSAEKSDPTNTKIDNIINDIRSISRNLHPIMFDKIGLKASVEQLTERAQAVNDFMVTSEINYEGSLATSDELQMYRIIQEALSNVIKYADAMAAKITILEKNDALYVEIKDNGKGFNVKEILNGSKSFGLHNIIERSKAIGGKTKITSNKNGTSILIQIKKS